MIVIYGTRHYGKVDAYAEQYEVTRFAHIYWLPLVPIGSMWVTRRQGDQLFGFDMGLSLKSTVAGYARIWGPIAAAIAIATMSPIGFGIAAALMALSVWSWTWRSRRGQREVRRALFHQLTMGTACDPLRMPRKLADRLWPEVEARYAEVSDGKSPNDVARFGGETVAQAMHAYTVLRFVAATAPRKTAADARAASERILDAIRDEDPGALAEGGPYRGKPLAVEATSASPR